MVQVDIRYEGSLRCCAVHGPSKSEMRTDAPVDNHGRGDAFSPTDLVGTALGTCMLTIMGLAAQQRGIAIEGSRARVVKQMAADPVRRIGRLEVTLEIVGDHDEQQRRLLETAARGCPVYASLAPEVEVVLSFAWGAPAA